LSAVIFLVVLILVIFAADLGWRWWRENEWKRRGPSRDDD